MRKPRLEYLVKARADYAMKTSLEQLGVALNYHDESDLVRAALRRFIHQHRHHLGQAQQISNR